jgi:hypothetical protein
MRISRLDSTKRAWDGHSPDCGRNLFPNRDGRSYQRRWQIGFDGKETNVDEKQVDYAIGSGNHSFTYLHRAANGALQLLPLSWYSEKGGYWDMSPGYDQADFPGSVRPPAESMRFGRNFRFGKEGRYNFFLRAEFQNIFNRLFLSPPQTGNQGLAPGGSPATIFSPLTTSGGVLTGGYGYINTVMGAGAQPRSGQLVGRFTF